ncbi:hypothetical protein Glove_624g23 [Diversispora epigaea]|uniref:Uncharacterized protein n=1 Tax=Diversispora epigaea TaxID=1348612 RepID=A0A397GAE6_9GLOM|nr:hypothetical protein Glove_624g23 [Diversispora epigaea]
MESKFVNINDKRVNKKENSNNGGFRKYLPSLFGKNRLRRYSYNAEIKCPPPYGCRCTTDFIDENYKKVTFCEAVEVGPATQSYNRSGQLYSNKKNEEIDVWFIGETHARTKYNLTQWVNKNHHDQEEVWTSLNEIKKNSGKWGPGEECRIWKP